MNTAEYLQEHGVKPSYPRLKILDYMFDKKNHPTVDMLFEDLSKEIPTLSRTTVYNTVNLFYHMGLVQKLGIDAQEARYDADVSVHAHFQCDKCGEIKDLTLDGELPGIKEIDEIKVREVQYNLKGLCSKCKDAKSIL